MATTTSSRTKFSRPKSPGQTNSSSKHVRGIKRVDLAYVEVASSEDARDINRDIVLEIIRSKQPVARADLARLSGLQPSTISAIVEQLIEEGWVSEGEAERRPRGRRPTMLSLNAELAILAVDVRPQHASVALVDLNGGFLARESVALGVQPQKAVEKILAKLQAIREAHPERSIEGVGMSLPGRVDPETQRLLLAPNMKWGNFEVKATMERAMGLQVELANAANACLLAELWSGRMDGVRDAVLVTAAEGVGAAILANGQLVTSRSGLAGEFGHSPMDPNGPVCGCGQRGCWEVFASSGAALRFHAELAPRAEARDIRELLQWAEEGDTKAVEALTRQAEHLGRGLRLVTVALAPELILIAGDLTAAWERFGPVVEREMRATMLAGAGSGYAPRLEITSGGELSRLRGAAAVVLQRHSGYSRAGKADSARVTTAKKARKRM
jgi:predicted NBD/HSP70 family sugar kinase